MRWRTKQMIKQVNGHKAGPHVLLSTVLHACYQQRKHTSMVATRIYMTLLLLIINCVGLVKIAGQNKSGGFF